MKLSRIFYLRSMDANDNRYGSGRYETLSKCFRLGLYCYEIEFERSPKRVGAIRHRFDTVSELELYLSNIDSGVLRHAAIRPDAGAILSRSSLYGSEMVSHESRDGSGRCGMCSSLIRS